MAFYSITLSAWTISDEDPIPRKKKATSTISSGSHRRPCETTSTVAGVVKRTTKSKSAESLIFVVRPLVSIGVDQLVEIGGNKFVDSPSEVTFLEQISETGPLHFCAIRLHANRDSTAQCRCRSQ